MAPFFTLVIPTKNRIALLKECVESVQNQSFESFELVIVDDRSEDGSKDWVLSLKDPRIIYVPNKGIERSAARNTGMDYAKGKYICFVDDDDLLTPSYLNDFYLAIDSIDVKCEMIYRTNFKYFGNLKDSRIGKVSAYFTQSDYSNELDFVIKEFTGVYTFCFPIETARRFRFDERFYLWEDTHFLIRLMLDDVNIFQLNGSNYLYRLHPQMSGRSESSNQFNGNLDNNLAAMNDIIKNHGQQLKQKVDLNILEMMMIKKKLEYAGQANILYLPRKGFSLFMSTFRKGFYFSLWKNYGYYFVSLARSIF